jgi:hypothetical protein
MSCESLIHVISGKLQVYPPWHADALGQTEGRQWTWRREVVFLT